MTMLRMNIQFKITKLPKFLEAEVEGPDSVQRHDVGDFG